MRGKPLIYGTIIATIVSLFSVTIAPVLAAAASPTPSTPADYTDLFTNCLANTEVNKSLIQNMVIKDNGASPPSINFTAQELKGGCKWSLPAMTFSLAAYEGFKNGNVSFFGAIGGAVIPALGVWQKVSSWANDTNDSVRFIFKETQANAPVYLIVDTDTDAEFYVINSDGSADSVAGALAPIFNSNINASPAFYSVIGNRVFLKDCSGGGTLAYPNDNGGVYSYPSNKPNSPTGCLYHGDDGWLAKWGTVGTGASDSCNLDTIFRDKNGFLAGAFKCIYDALVSPAVTWATGWVIKAAGISYIGPLYLPNDVPKHYHATA